MQKKVSSLFSDINDINGVNVLYYLHRYIYNNKIIYYRL